MTAYVELLDIVLKFLKNTDNGKAAELFCEKYMDTFYDRRNTLECEVPMQIYNVFDDINLICDSYEPDEKIRYGDKYCINEIELKEKISECYRNIVSIQN